MAQALKTQLAELAALKTSLDGANRTANTQFTKISDRLDALERAQTDPSGKLAHLADAVDRLEKRIGAAPETTGSIPASQPAAATATPAPDTNVAGPILTTGSCRTCTTAAPWSRAVTARNSSSPPAASFPVLARSRR